MVEALLSVHNLSCHIGGVVALDGVDLDVDEGEFVGIVGPNGAGKTTLFNTITGFVPYQEGQVVWQGESLRGWKPHKIVGTGLMRTFQNAGGFGEMTVRQNVLLACRGRDREYMYHICELLQIDRHFDKLVEGCTLATRKLVGIAMAAVKRPRMLLFDEPLSGLDASDRDAVVDVVRLVRDEGVTVLLIEHDVERTLKLVDRIVILDVGRKVADGPPAELVTKPEFGNVYLKV